jgi:hypothetical protein
MIKKIVSGFITLVRWLGIFVCLGIAFDSLYTFSVWYFTEGHNTVGLKAHRTLLITILITYGSLAVAVLFTGATHRLQERMGLPSQY